ncbi:fructose-bisphosphatase class III [Allofustis seminis]|uniref:fructose-bisphosphatase class III n=1 Tax=Allofustis seminis TaxID=166939 RepID=UPI00035FE496|nr:fructose-bisphosphatase class III [Allofustis seminis]
MQTKYYQLLKEKFPTKESVLTEIINLKAILELPKGTEHFMSDLHGEFTTFNHVMRNGSGSIKAKLQECFADAPDKDLDELAVLIYYPTDKLNLEKRRRDKESLEKWYVQQLEDMLTMTRFSSKKYSRSKVRRALPPQYQYILEELLYDGNQDFDKNEYYQSILDNLLMLNQMSSLLRELAITIQNLVVDHLHIVGDIYDRGPEPDKIIERLMWAPSVDIQWGNHDILWMAALAGSKVSIAGLIRISARYGYLSILEDHYGINLRPFVEYAEHYYTPIAAFAPKLKENHLEISEKEKDRMNVVQQAAMILQSKLEGQLYERRPEFEMDDRILLKHIDPDNWSVQLNGESYSLKNFHAPTIDFSAPLCLTQEEHQLLNQLRQSFQTNEKFKRHIHFLLNKGSLYLIYNNNLLLHGGISMNEDGTFSTFHTGGRTYQGRQFLDFCEQQVYKSFKRKDTDDFATDFLWYLWCGPKSPLFGKNAMKTFERYYLEDKRTHVEVKDPYYLMRDQEEICLKVLHEMGIYSDNSHIISGHIPVKEKDGENPVKANRRLIVIDGGYSKAYQATTGIAGYTLLFNSYGLQLVAHQPFESIENAVMNKTDILSTKRLVESVDERLRVKDTTIGEQLQIEVDDLEFLFEYFEQF